MSKCGYPMYVAILLLLLTVGCRERYEQIELESPEKEKTADNAQDEEETVKWEDLGPTSSDDPKLQPQFIEASEADQAPNLEVNKFSGEKIEVDPARKGKVTIVVFWCMDDAANQAATLYAFQLVQEYPRDNLRGINIVEKTPSDSHRSAPQFLEKWELDFPSYYDDFTALETMGKAAGVRVNRDIPAIFLIDKKGRVRFFKRGFSYSTSGAKIHETAEARITENAAEGERIKDYVGRLLKEE